MLTYTHTNNLNCTRSFWFLGKKCIVFSLRYIFWWASDIVQLVTYLFSMPKALILIPSSALTGYDDYPCYPHARAVEATGSETSTRKLVEDPLELCR